MRSFTEVLSEVSTAEELREAMRDLVDRGSRNWTYGAAAQYVTPELLEELTQYFDDVTGEPQWPNQPPTANTRCAVDNPADSSSLSDLVVSFHDRLSVLRQSNILPSGTAATLDKVPTCSSPDTGDVASSSEVLSLGGTEPEPEVLSTSGSAPTLCAICLRTTDQLAHFRGKPMCRDCAELLRGY